MSAYLRRSARLDFMIFLTGLYIDIENMNVIALTDHSIIKPHPVHHKFVPLLLHSYNLYYFAYSFGRNFHQTGLNSISSPKIRFYLFSNRSMWNQKDVSHIFRPYNASHQEDPINRYYRFIVCKTSGLALPSSSHFKVHRPNLEFNKKKLNLIKS